MLLKKELEFGIEELNKEPANIYKCLNELREACAEAAGENILKAIKGLDIYASRFLSLEEYYSEISDFPKDKLMKKDHEYYRATFYRLRYHYLYYNIDDSKYPKLHMFGLHLADNLKIWLDFHLDTLDKELIEHLKEKIKNLDTNE